MNYVMYKNDATISLSDVVLIGLEGCSIHQNYYFTIEEARNTIDKIHGFDKKAMVWVNRFVFEPELSTVTDNLESLFDKVDGFMLMDFGLMKVLRDKGFDKEIICQTDTTMTNWRDARFLLENGFDKIVAARELSLEEIHEMARNLENQMIFHVFGYQRLSTSRRPLLSAYGDQIEISIQQRKFYRLREDSRDYHFQIMEEESGTHIFDQKVYWALNEIPQLRELGVRDFLFETIGISDSLIEDVLEGANPSVEYYTSRYPEMEFTRALLDVKTTEKKIE